MEQYQLSMIILFIMALMAITLMWSLLSPPIEVKVIITRSHLDGKQMVFRIGKYGISAVNAPMLHSYPFFCEFAVLRFTDGDDFELTYQTELTQDVVVCGTAKEAHEWLDNAIAHLKRIQ